MAGEAETSGGVVKNTAAASPGGPMAMGAAAGMGLVGGALGWIGHRAQASAMRDQTAEELRRRRAADAQKLGQATAAAGASGVESGSASLSTYLTSMQEEMQRQQEWARSAGATNASAMDAAGGLGFFTDLGSTLSGYAKANNYWRGP
jgi:hypothetical protein